MATMSFHIADYIVMVGFLVISMAIGVYYGFFNKQKTKDEYLLGNRQMSILPVTMSLLVTYQSAISVTGVPADVYIYNTMIFIIFIAVSVGSLIQGLWIVPLIYPLHLTSVYEYLGLRFQSRAVQLFCTLMGMLQTLLYMSIVLFAPALALEAVAGIPLWISVVLVGVVGSIYTSIGGLRSVIWTDVFQFVMLYGGMTAVLIMGCIRVGGISKVMSLAKEGNRIVFGADSLDPRVRHTLASCLVGGFFNWLPNNCNQSAIQRISSMQSRRDAKIACLLNVPLGLLYGAILILCGLLVYAYFEVEGCDPFQNGDIGNQNQIMPYFVMHVLNNLPGLAGVFIAALFSGALSSLSSGINSMAANTVEDILGVVLKSKSQLFSTLVAKLVVLVYGAAAVGLAYLVNNLSGPVTQIALTAMGATGGPIAGIFFLAAIFPQANWIGALVGGILAICLNMWIAVGTVVFGVKSPASRPVATHLCSHANTSILSNMTFSDHSDRYTLPTTPTTLGLNETSPMALPADTEHLAIYDVSYLYLGLIGFAVAFVLGLIISIATGMDHGNPTEAKYLFPCCRKFWRAGHLKVSPVYGRAQKTSPRNGADQEMSDVAPIRSLNMAWYNKLQEDEL